ncbi:uncharacterized protein LOC122794722 [Protopterus annectens]|uniref:uncharacterized protein LOC122794722 n=1 Tax=Protopterus annectens TaxID=7888 RepID=UPI001CFB1619|nr:uncharacterized protein LOC122794722 [Protopterus annectens]
MPETVAAEAKGHGVSEKERTALNKVFSSLCPFHEQLLRSMLKFLVPSKSSSYLYCNKWTCSTFSRNQPGCIKNNAAKTYYLRSHKTMNKDYLSSLESEACFPPTCTCIKDYLPYQSSDNGCIKMAVSKQNSTTYCLQRYTGLKHHYGDCPHAKISTAFSTSEVCDQPNSANINSRVCSPSPPPLSPVQSNSSEHYDESNTAFSTSENKKQEPTTKLPPSLFPVEKCDNHVFHSSIYTGDKNCQFEHEMQTSIKEFNKFSTYSKNNFEKDEGSILYQTAMERLNEKFKTIENTVKEMDLSNCIKHESNQEQSHSVRKLLTLLCHAEGDDYDFTELLQQYEKKTEKKVIQTRFRKRQENLILNSSDPVHLRWKTLQLKRELASLNHTFAVGRFVCEHTRKKSVPEDVNGSCNNSKAVGLLNEKCLISADGPSSSLGSLALHDMRKKQDIQCQTESLQYSEIPKNVSFSEMTQSVIFDGSSGPIVKSSSREFSKRTWTNVSKNESFKCKKQLRPLKRVDTRALLNRTRRNIVPPERFSLYITEPRQMYNNAYLTKKCFQQRSPRGTFCFEGSQNKWEENMYCRGSGSAKDLPSGQKDETTVSKNSCIKLLVHIEPLKNMVVNTAGHTAAERLSKKHLLSEECKMSSNSEEDGGMHKHREKNMKNNLLHFSSGVSEEHTSPTTSVQLCSFKEKVDSFLDADRKIHETASQKKDAKVKTGTVRHGCCGRVLRSQSAANRKYCKSPHSENCHSIGYGHNEQLPGSESDEKDSVATYNSPIKLMFLKEVNSSDGLKYTLKSFRNCSDFASNACTLETSANVRTLTEVNDSLQVPAELTTHEKSPEKFIQTCTVSYTTKQEISSSDCIGVVHGHSVIKLSEMAAASPKTMNESDLKRKPGRPMKIGPQVEKQVKRPIGRPPKPKMTETEGADSGCITAEAKEFTQFHPSEVVDENNKNITVPITSRRSGRIKRLVSKHENCMGPMDRSNLITKSPDVTLNIAASRFNLQNMKNHMEGVSSENELEQCSYNTVRPVKTDSVLPQQIFSSSVCPHVKTSLPLRKPRRPAKVKSTGISVTIDASTPHDQNVRINEKLHHLEKDALMLQRKMIAEQKPIQRFTVADKLDFIKNNSEAHHSEQIKCSRMKKTTFPLRQSTRIKKPSLQFLHSVASMSSFTSSNVAVHKSGRVLVNKANAPLGRSNLLSMGEKSDVITEGNNQINISNSPKELLENTFLANSVNFQMEPDELNQVLKSSANPVIKSDTSVRWWPNSLSYEALMNRLNNRFEEITNSWIPVNDLNPESSISEEKKSAQRDYTLAVSDPFSYHLLEVTVTPVKMLFQTKYDMNKLCTWFMQTTETRSLPIKRKENARSPLKITSTKEIKLCDKQMAVSPSPQAERLKKHLKKFALASPARAFDQIQVHSNMLQSKGMKFRNRRAAKMRRAKLWTFCKEKFWQNCNITCKTVPASCNPVRRNLKFECQSHSSKTGEKKLSCLSHKKNCNKAETVMTLFSNACKNKDMVPQEVIAIPFLNKNASLTKVSQEGRVNEIPQNILKSSEKCSDQVENMHKNNGKPRNFRECRVFLRKMSTLDEKNYQMDLVQEMLGPVENDEKISSDKNYALRSHALTVSRESVLITKNKDAVGKSITKRKLRKVLPKIVLRSFGKPNDHMGIPELTVRSICRRSKESNAASYEVPALVNERKRQRPQWCNKDLKSAKKQRRQSC